MSLSRSLTFRTSLFRDFHIDLLTVFLTSAGGNKSVSEDYSDITPALFDSRTAAHSDRIRSQVVLM